MPGPRMMNGTRIPPSETLPLAPNNGAGLSVSLVLTLLSPGRCPLSPI